MSELEDFYEARLYPVQDGVLQAIARAFAGSSDREPFLTGGTALSRRYYRHRYSDDLDLFFCRSDTYSESVEKALSALIANNFAIEAGSLVRLEQFTRLIATRTGVRLQIDFVNDTADRIGDLSTWEIYPWVDSVENILTNKLTALYRLEAKDVVDLREIALNYAFNWSDAFRAAEKKESGLDAVSLTEIVTAFPGDLFDAVKWRKRPDPERFLADLKRIANDMLDVAPNSLVK